jgi:simple sugar transport system ATP-binding protein
MDKKPLIEIKNLVKKFGSFTALNGVSLDVYPGEVHALLGDNGAGKSTLIKVLSGVHPMTSGEIKVDGEIVNFTSPRQASDAGIGTVYQDLALNALTSVTRNFFLGREIKKGPGAFGLLQMEEMDKITTEEMSKIGINISNPNQPVGTMSGGQRQTLAIARAIYFGAKILILDEPYISIRSKTANGSFKNNKKSSKFWKYCNYTYYAQ